MSLPALTLWADSIKNEFVSEWQSNNAVAALQFRQGDSIGIELHWVEQTLGNPMKEVVWPSAANITLAIGRLDAAPTSGSFRLAYGGSQTPDLAFNASAADLQAALNALGPIALEGGVIVIKNGTTYRINWVTPRTVSSAITVYENDLTPTSSIGIGVARTGSILAGHIVQLHIKQSPVALCTSWVTSPAPTITVTETHAPAYSGDFRIWRLLITPAPRAGTLRISKVINGTLYWSNPINIVGLSEVAISSATGLGCNKVTDFEYEIYQAQIAGDATVNVSLLDADQAGLIGFSSKYGELNLNSLDVELLLQGGASATAVCEIEVEMSGKRQTLVQADCTIYNDLIDTDAYTLVEWGDVIPADSVVRYDTAQTLTSGQQAQARTNIAAVGLSSLTPYTTKDNELEARIANLEAVSPTSDDLAAITGANTPSATNVFVTTDDLTTKADAVHTHAIADITDLTTTLTNKAEQVHSHLIADVTGLQDTLDDLATKADGIHTHAMADVTGLDAALLGKADTTHLHQIVDVVGLQAALDSVVSADQAAALSAATPAGTASNPFATESWVESNAMSKNPTVNTSGISGTHTGTNYPYEIQLVINGTTYYVPARI
jgi:hypothetical protein